MTPSILSKSVSLLTLSALISSTLPVHAAPVSIPDEIDFKKYEAIYSRAKVSADQKRLQATEAETLLGTQEQELQSLSQQLEAQRSALVQTETSLAQVDQTIAQLRGQNGTLATEVNQHQAAFESNVQEIRNQRSILDGLTQELQTAQGHLARINAEYQREAQDYEGLRRRLETATRERDAAITELNRVVGTLESHEREQGSQQRALQEAESNSRILRQRVEQLSPVVAQLQSEVESLNREIEARRRPIEPARQQMEQARAALVTARNQLNATQTALTNAQRAVDQNASDRQSLGSQIPSQEASLVSKKRLLSELEGKLSTLQNENASLARENQTVDARVATISPKIAELRREQGALGSQVDRKKAEIAAIRFTRPNDPRIPVMEKELQELEGKRDQVAQERLALENEKNGLDARKNEIVSRLRQVASEIARLRSQQGSLPQEIAGLESSIKQAQERLRQLEGDAGRLTQERDRAKSAQQQAQSQVATAESAFNSANAEYERVAAGLRPLEQKFEQVSQELNQKKAALEEARRVLAQAESSIPTIRNRLQQIAREVGELRESERGLRVRVEKSTRAHEQILRLAEQAYPRVEELHRRVEARAAQVARIDGDRRSVESHLVELNRFGSELQSAIQIKTQQIAANQQSIRENEQFRVRAQQELPGMRRQVADSERAVAALDTRVAQQRILASNLGREAQTLESRAQAAYSDYSVRKQRYDALLADAQEEGTSQGDRDGRVAGGTRGEQEGREQGTAKGKSAGTQEGLADGLRRGKADGDAQGYAEGLKKGEASATDYQRGVALGIEEGKKDALTEANRVDLPRGQSDRRKELTAQLPANRVVLDNRMGTGAMLSAVSSNRSVSVGFHDGVARFSAMTRVEFSAQALATSCKQTFVDFKKACEAAYATAYQRSLNDTYQDNYQRAYAEAFEKAQRVAFEANKNVRYKEGFDSVYASAVQRGVTEGAAIARNRGLADGKKQGFDATIDAARAEAYNRGVQQTDQLFASAAVLEAMNATFTRLASDGSREGDLVAGDVAVLSLEVANFGSQASRAKLNRVEIEAVTPNLAIENKVVDLVSVPAKSVAKIENILGLKVLESATSGSIEKVQIKITLEDGRVLKSTVSVKISPKLEAVIKKASFDATPKVGSKQSVKVTIANTGKISTTLPTQIELSTSESGADVTILSSVKTIKKISAGKSLTVSGLSFKVLSKEGLDRGLKLKLILRHGSNVVAQQELLLTAK